MSTESPNPENPEETNPVATSDETSTEFVPEVEAAPSLSSGLDIGSDADESEESIVRTAPVIRGKVDRFGVAWGTGRRKTAVARVRIRDGSGAFRVNGREFVEYFPTERDQQLIHAPLKAAGLLGQVDIDIRVHGGGTTGQTGAIVLGIARAVQAKNPALHSALSEGGFLTRDGRMVERKKYGFKKARRSFQFSKR